MSGRIRVHHVITSLAMGGAEMMLLRLLERMDRTRFEARVISLRDVNVMGQRMQECGIDVRGLGLHPRRPSPLRLAQLHTWLRRERPHVVQTWMTHADLIGGLAAKLAGGIPTAWGIHAGKLDPVTHGKAAVATVKMNAKLSHLLPTRIVCCSETSRIEHARLGYAEVKMQVIPNGFDLELFRPDPDARAALLGELGLPRDALVVGQIGRFHAQKDHRNLLEAMQQVFARHPDAHLVLAGRDVVPENAQLVGWIGRWSARVHLLGQRSDTPRLTAAFDIACSSSSYGEAFPLVIGEAMAAGVPCVTTDCGDSAQMVADTGLVVPIQNAPAFADALEQLIALGVSGRAQLGAKARERIRTRFELGEITRRYHEMFAELARRA